MGLRFLRTHGGTHWSIFITGFLFPFQVYTRLPCVYASTISSGNISSLSAAITHMAVVWEKCGVRLVFWDPLGLFRACLRGRGPEGTFQRPEGQLRSGIRVQLRSLGGREAAAMRASSPWLGCTAATALWWGVQAQGLDLVAAVIGAMLAPPSQSGLDDWKRSCRSSSWHGIWCTINLTNGHLGNMRKKK